MSACPTRHLVLVLGDQLDEHSTAFDGFDPSADVVWMAEVAAEAEHVWSSKARIAIFLSAMRHFRDRLLARAVRLRYRQLDDPDNRGSLAAELSDTIRELQPHKLVAVQPGEWRVQELLRSTAQFAHRALQ